MPIAVVSCGGTIASTEQSGGDARPELSGDALVASVPGLGDLASFRTHDFATIPSPDVTLDQLVDLVALVRDLDADPDVDGVVVTQGTDTLEVASYFVDCCYDGDTPVVFTGAMRNPSLASPDGPGNLHAATLAALDDRAADAGVLVAFNYRVHAARDVTKTNTQNPDTFRSPEFGPVAAVEEDRVVWRRTPVNPDPTLDPDPDALTRDVPAIPVTLDMPGRLLDAAADCPAVCLGVMGGGHVPAAVVPALETLRDGGVELVVTSLSPTGRLARSTYEFPGSERTLQDLGCRYSDVNLRKTRMKTILALAADRLDDAFDID